MDGLAFSITLMTILLAHELGHYFACRYYGIDASLPYFLPAPTPIGTLGAFIRIRSPIYTRKALFDVGIAGPLAGFVVLVPALAIGIAYSKVVPGIAARGDLIFGVPGARTNHGLAGLSGRAPLPTSRYIPIARGAWVGILGDGSKPAPDRPARWRPCFVLLYRAEAQTIVASVRRDAGAAGNLLFA